MVINVNVKKDILSLVSNVINAKINVKIVKEIVIDVPNVRGN